MPRSQPWQDDTGCGGSVGSSSAVWHSRQTPGHSTATARPASCHPRKSCCRRALSRPAGCFRQLPLEAEIFYWTQSNCACGYKGKASPFSSLSPFLPATCLLHWICPLSTADFLPIQSDGSPHMRCVDMK